MPVIGLEAMV
ncbi:hypothetical protein Bhyg_00940 [Pseudolycoriella hygida]|uniref:Uncharacterized protein n=1 Tax=Pseudolycoriella hygida TaxID=35572 RepID=A0A9Q0N8F5_9DIPT|nr:hypothetical protein Bhyg_00940 [Pseudolycoriella hygida]